MKNKQTKKLKVGDKVIFNYNGYIGVGRIISSRHGTYDIKITSIIKDNEFYNHTRLYELSFAELQPYSSYAVKKIKREVLGEDKKSEPTTTIEETLFPCEKFKPGDRVIFNYCGFIGEGIVDRLEGGLIHIYLVKIKSIFKDDPSFNHTQLYLNDNELQPYTSKETNNLKRLYKGVKVEDKKIDIAPTPTPIPTSPIDKFNAKVDYLEEQLKIMRDTISALKSKSDVEKGSFDLSKHKGKFKYKIGTKIRFNLRHGNGDPKEDIMRKNTSGVISGYDNEENKYLVKEDDNNAFSTSSSFLKLLMDMADLRGYLVDESDILEVL